MITLKEALKLSAGEVAELRNELEKKIFADRELGAYVEQLANLPLDKLGAGVPIAIKDNIQVKGWSVTSASKILQGYIAPYNATVIEKLLAAGLAPFGRTNMDEFAMGNTTENSYYGKTLNPLNRERVPGGSSGGCRGRRRASGGCSRKRYRRLDTPACGILRLRRAKADLRTRQQIRSGLIL